MQFSRSVRPTLTALAAALLLTQAAPGAEIRSVSRVAQATIEQSPRDLPVTCQADVVVAGGGASGVAAALRAAADGHSVVIVEERNCLGHEAATQWALFADESKIGSQFPLAAKLQADLAGEGGRTAPIGAERCKAALHRRVAAQAKIRVFFASLPAGVVLERGRVCGLVVVNRAGRQVFLAKAVVDATEDERVATAAGVERLLGAAQLRARRLIVVSPMPKAPLSLPAALAACSVGPWRGLLSLDMVAGGDWSQAQAATLAQAMALRDALTAAQGKLDSFVVSPEIVVQGLPGVRRSPSEAQLPASGEGLTLARPAAAHDVLEFPLSAALVSGETAGRLAGEMADKRPGFLAAQTPGAATVGAIRELLAGPDAGVRYAVLRQAAAALPVSAETDVLVIGGGTSGALAAIAAGRQGARVILVETLPNLGGTSSNRVNAYYWGVPWKSLLAEEIDAPIGAQRSQRQGGLQKVAFLGEEKKVVLQQLAASAGVQIYYRSFGAGAVVEEKRVVGAVIENASGRHVIRARVVVDATGQGDVAAAAGAAFDVGRPSDGFLNEAEHGPLRDALDPEDLSKFYLRYPQKALTLNIRESRRIVGDYTVTFQDALSGRRFPDVIARWRSNYDTHFPHSANESDAAQDWTGILGLFRKPLWGSIPYRAILPKGLENVLVVGKAYSTTHDALIGGRMQRDLQHLGEAAGVAAAMACREKTSPRTLSIDALQANLVRLGVLLPEELAEARIAPSSAARIDLAATAARLGTEQALDAMVELYLAGAASAQHLVPLLKSSDAARRTEAALVLGMLDRAEAVPTLLERLQARDPRTFVFTLPEASSRPSVPVYYSAVILLGRQRVKEAAKPIAKLLKDPQACKPDLASYAIAALGRIGDKAYASAIRPYLALAKPVGLLEENQRFETHWGVATNAARALAQLGDNSGVPLLVELLDADQSRLRNYAQRLLEEITGRRYGKDRQAWRRWWREQQATRTQ